MTDRGRAYGLQTRSSKNQMKMEWIGHILSSSPPIAENIFKYLNIRQLNSCAQVCNLWNRLVQTEKKRRKGLLNFLEVYQCQYHTICRPLHCLYCEKREAFNYAVNNSIQEQLCGTNNDPQFCLAFATEPVTSYAEKLAATVANSMSYPTEPPAKKPRQRHRKQETYKRIHSVEVAEELLLKRYLPKHCELGFCVSIGIVGSHPRLGSVGYVRTLAISGLLFPKLPGVDIYKIPIDSQTTNLSSFIPRGKKPKCLLVFLSKDTGLGKETRLNINTAVIDLVNDFMMQEKENIALGGAVIETTSFSFNYDFALAFSGDNVEAASVILGPLSVRESIEEDAKKLQVLKDSGLLANRCIAFMFTHSLMIFHECVMENLLFRKMFPQVPLLGVTANVEIGNNYLPGKSASDDDEVPHERCERLWFDYYRTVYVLISFKN